MCGTHQYPFILGGGYELVLKTGVLTGIIAPDGPLLFMAPDHHIFNYFQISSSLCSPYIATHVDT